MIAKLLLAQGIRTLKDGGNQDAAREARMLLALALGIETSCVSLITEDEVTPDAVAKFTANIARRVNHEPMSHIRGTRDFYGRSFMVTPDVLDPRPDTETLIETALSAPFDRVLDLGTGSGCILVTLLALRPKAIGTGVDLSDRALRVAHHNGEAHGVADRSVWQVGSWFDGVTGIFDLIVSNPPYIAAHEMKDLQPDVRLHEPRMALTDEADGLTCYREIIAAADGHLVPEGRLIVEIGPTQADAVQRIMEVAGLQGITVIQDLNGRDRVVCGHKSG